MHSGNKQSSAVQDPRISDDILVDRRKTRSPKLQVDFLSHHWQEPDLWCSWRYIRQRVLDLAKRTRLENASWRVWSKLRYKLETVPPETLNWFILLPLNWNSLSRFKDYDETSLFGPLQPHPHSAGQEETPRFSPRNPELKSILKKPLSHSRMVLASLGKEKEGNLFNQSRQCLESPTGVEFGHLRACVLVGSQSTSIETSKPMVRFNEHVQQFGDEEDSPTDEDSIGIVDIAYTLFFFLLELCKKLVRRK